MAKKVKMLQAFRFLTQLMFLFLLPGTMSLAFGEVKQIYLILISGNTDFMQLFPRLIEIMVIIPFTILLGRFFCGWFCAFGTFNDIMHLLASKVFRMNFKVNEKVDSLLKYLKYAILMFILWFSWTKGSMIFAAASPWDAFAQIPDFREAAAQYIIGFTLLGFIGLGAMFIERFFCKYLCPLGAIFSGLSLFGAFKIDKPNDKCGNCRVCTNECSMGIKLYETSKVTGGECINCLKCVEVCPRKNAQASIHKQKLNPVLAGILAISVFAGLYYTSSMIGSEVQAKANAEAANYIKKKIPEINASIKKNELAEISNKQDTESSASIADSNVVKQNSSETKSDKAVAKVAEVKSNNNAIDKSIPVKKAAVVKNNTSVQTNRNAVSNKVTKTTTVTQNNDGTVVNSGAVSSSPKTKYKDGTYTGVGRGFRPGLEVAVTIKNDRITDIQILSNNETPSFSSEPFNVIPQEIISSQSTNVDAVTGATRSSNGIMMAVDDALGQAEAANQ